MRGGISAGARSGRWLAPQSKPALYSSPASSPSRGQDKIVRFMTKSKYAVLLYQPHCGSVFASLPSAGRRIHALYGKHRRMWMDTSTGIFARTC